MYTWPERSDELFKYVPVSILRQCQDFSLCHDAIDKQSEIPFLAKNPDFKVDNPLTDAFTHSAQKVCEQGSYYIDLSCPSYQAIHPACHLVIKQGQEVVLVLASTKSLGHSFSTLSLSITVESKACLTVLSYVDIHDDAKTLNFANIDLAQDSQVYWHQAIIDGGLSYTRIKANLQKNAHFSSRALLVTTDQSFHAFLPIVTHCQGQSTCDLKTRSLAFDKSQVLSHGKICVPKDSAKIEAHYSSDNLSLSPQAKIYARPDLDIATDDVICSHGVTLGSLDESHIFYLQSRHLDRQSAKLLLLKAFVTELLADFPPQVSLPSLSLDVPTAISEKINTLLRR